METGARLFWRYGYAATGMKKVVTEAKAPFGSVYHFFPGGKEELAAEAVRWSGAQYAALVEASFDVVIAELAADAESRGTSDDAVRGPAVDVDATLERVFALAGEHVAASGWADACPIATVALEMSGESEPIRSACADVFAQWTQRLVVRLVDLGVPTAAAPELATTFLALLEGAFVLVRAQRTAEPLLVAGRAIAALARHAAASD